MQPIHTNTHVGWKNSKQEKTQHETTKEKDG